MMGVCMDELAGSPRRTFTVCVCVAVVHSSVSQRATWVQAAACLRLSWHSAQSARYAQSSQLPDRIRLNSFPFSLHLIFIKIRLTPRLKFENLDESIATSRTSPAVCPDVRRIAKVENTQDPFTHSQPFNSSSHFSNEYKKKPKRKKNLRRDMYYIV